jgi:hypothetical protein
MNTQREIPLAVALSGPAKVAESDVAAFTSTSDAIRWSFKNRTNEGGKPIAWLAHHMGMQRQRLSRILNHGDFKLDPASVHLWDCLVGNQAVSQYIELEKQRLNEQVARVVNEAIKARFAA